MYDVGATKNRKLVFGVATAAIVLIGGYIPVFAIQFQVRARARRANAGEGATRGYPNATRGAISLERSRLTNATTARANRSKTKPRRRRLGETRFERAPIAGLGL
jgi:hypothetical protein